MCFYMIQKRHPKVIVSAYVRIPRKGVLTEAHINMLWSSGPWRMICLALGLKEFALCYERHPESMRTVPWLRPAGRDSGSAASGNVRGRVPIHRPYVRDFVFQPPPTSLQKSSIRWGICGSRRSKILPFLCFTPPNIVPNPALLVF